MTDTQARLDWLIERIAKFVIDNKDRFIVKSNDRVVLITLETLRVKNRKRELVITRQLVWYFLNKFTKMSLGSLGNIFYKDHTSVIYGIEVINNLLYTNIFFKQEVIKIEIDFLNEFDIITNTLTERQTISGIVFTSPFKSKESIGRILLGI